ncbi:MAG TPA: chalcone isomerase family protein [Burkholderiaceae bacterium]|nr:chalcone isomerase family protein [Burkholderiaceae bacterium]
MKRLLAAALLSLTATFNAAHAAEVEGVKIPDQVSVAGQSLVLNGAGMRSRFGFKVYVGALYLPRKTGNPGDIYASKGAKRVQLSIVRDLSAKDLGEAFLKGVRENLTPEELQKVSTQIVQFGQIFATIPGAKPGDVVTLDYIPSRGTVVTAAGKEQAPIPGDDFFDAVLKIWLGNKPVQADLKEAMLGKK